MLTKDVLISFIQRPLQIPDRVTYPLLNAENEERFPVYKSRTHRMDMTPEDDLRPPARREPFMRRDRVLGDTMNPEGTTKTNFKVYAAGIYKVYLDLISLFLFSFLLSLTEAA